MRNKRSSPSLTAFLRGHDGPAHIDGMWKEGGLALDNAGIVGALSGHYAGVRTGGLHDASAQADVTAALRADLD
eukprot:264131-Chlamydomonas_euryale.AAC.1